MRQSAHHSDHFPPIPASHVPPPHPHRTPPDRPASTATRRATCRQTIRQVRPSSRHSQKRRTRRSLQPRPRTVRHTPRHLRPPTSTFKSRKGPREIGTVKKAVECRDESVAGKPHDCPRCTGHVGECGRECSSHLWQALIDKPRTCQTTSGSSRTESSHRDIPMRPPPPV